MIHQSKRKVHDISSSTNSAVKIFRLLRSSRGIKRHGLTIVAGEKIVHDLIKLRPELVYGWVTDLQGTEPPRTLPESIPWYRLSGELYRELDIHTTNNPLLIMHIPEIKEFNDSERPENVLLLVPFQDPSNVGAVIRSAAAFGIKTVVLLKEAALPFHHKALRASGPSPFLVTIYNGPSINDVAELGYPIVALSLHGTDIRSFSFPKRFALLPGIEGPGLPHNLVIEHKVSIPIIPDVESLNAGVATSIALYEWSHQTAETHENKELRHK